MCILNENFSVYIIGENLCVHLFVVIIKKISLKLIKIVIQIYVEAKRI